MKKFVFIAAVLGFTNVFVAMTQQKNSPIPLHNNGIETFTVFAPQLKLCNILLLFYSFSFSPLLLVLIIDF